MLLREVSVVITQASILLTEFIEISNVQLHLPHYKQNVKNVLWTNADTTIYMDIDITNIFQLDFDNLGNMLDIKVLF